MTAAAVVLVLTGCSGEDAAPAKKHTAPASSSGAATALASATAPTDEGITTAADFAGYGVSPSLAHLLVTAANVDGYGPAQMDFVYVAISTCRDVKAGSISYPELVAQDEANGASRTQAQNFNDFLRDQFCPAVRAAGDQPAPTATATTAAAPGMQGLGLSAAAFTSLYKAGSQGACRAAAGAPIGHASAYVLHPGATICLDWVGRPPLGDVQDQLQLVYDSPVPEATALRDAARLLPKDARRVQELTGQNPPYSSRPGSCASLLYHSAQFKTYMSRFDDHSEAGVTYDENLNVMLYSDRSTNDGSSSMYNGTVKFAYVGAGGQNFGYKSKVVTC